MKEKSEVLFQKNFTTPEILASLEMEGAGGGGLVALMRAKMDRIAFTDVIFLSGKHRAGSAKRVRGIFRLMVCSGGASKRSGRICSSVSDLKLNPTALGSVQYGNCELVLSMCWAVMSSKDKFYTAVGFTVLLLFGGFFAAIFIDWIGWKTLAQYVGYGLLTAWVLFLFVLLGRH